LHDSIKDDFVREMKKCIEQFFSKDASTSYNYGRIINEKAFNRLINYIKQGDVIAGGKYDAVTHYIEPTILENIPVDATVMGEEIFGPVLPIISFSTFEEAKNIIQKNPNPLAFYVFTESEEKEKKWLKEIAFGGGCVNNASWHITNPHLPFGGRGNSGIGAYHGKESFYVFSHRKAVMKTPTWLDLSIKYPPFKGKLKLFKKIIK
jgi:aldehyde dehydrogenase (NAD+)